MWVDKLQTLVNRTLRNMIGLGRGDAGVALAPIYQELGVRPIKAIVASARARAFCKASNLHTYICDLVGSPIISRHTTWTSGTVRWLGKWMRWSQVKEIGGIPNWENLNPDKLTELVRETVWKRFEESGRVSKLPLRIIQQLMQNTDYHHVLHLYHYICWMV